MVVPPVLAGAQTMSGDGGQTVPLTVHSVPATPVNCQQQGGVESVLHTNRAVKPKCPPDPGMPPIQVTMAPLLTNEKSPLSPFKWAKSPVALLIIQ